MKQSNVYLGLVMPSGEWWSPIRAALRYLISVLYKDGLFQWYPINITQLSKDLAYKMIEVIKSQLSSQY
jgi:hypothetical protein